MTTKAARIRQLLDAKVRNSMIADICQCREEYVRVVKQRLDPRRQEMDQAAHRARYWTADHSLMIRAGAIAYREARKAGKSVKEATQLCNTARHKAKYATSDPAAARQAYHAAKRGNANA